MCVCSSISKDNNQKLSVFVFAMLWLNIPCMAIQILKSIKEDCSCTIAVLSLLFRFCECREKNVLIRIYHWGKIQKKIVAPIAVPDGLAKSGATYSYTRTQLAYYRELCPETIMSRKQYFLLRNSSPRCKKRQIWQLYLCYLSHRNTLWGN